MSEQVPTGIFGGSFNPIHMGHIGLARDILRLTPLREVWFLVSPLNPFKQRSVDLLDDRLRFDMVRRALADEPGLVASDYEFGLPRPSYTWQTLARLREDHPDRLFTLIIGADNWLAFDRWAHPDDILRHHPVIVYPREGCPVDRASLPPRVTLVDTGLYPVSSTAIRQRVALGQPVDGLVPPAIIPMVERCYGSAPSLGE